MRGVGVLLAGVALWIGLPWTPAEAAPAGLKPRRVEMAASWEAHQFIQADGKGKVYLLRGDTLDVYPMTDGKPGKPVRLKRAGLIGDEITSAAISPGGSRWLLVTPKQALFFEDGKQKAIPAPGWLTTAAAFLGEEPAVAVLPVRLSRGERPKKLPQILKYDGRDWTLVVPVAPTESQTKGDPLGALLVNQTVGLASASGSKIWTFQPYAYRISRFSSLGKRDFGFVVDGGQVSYRDAQEQTKAQKDLERRLEERGHKPGTVQAGAVPAARVLLGVVQGRDGRVYMVSRTGKGGLAMDRYDPTTAMLERVPLALSAGDELSLAAGRDALYLVSKWGTGGRWSLSWEELEDAAWKEMKDVELLGATEQVGGEPHSAEAP